MQTCKISALKVVHISGPGIDEDVFASFSLIALLANNPALKFAAAGTVNLFPRSFFPSGFLKCS